MKMNCDEFSIAGFGGNNFYLSSRVGFIKIMAG